MPLLLASLVALVAWVAVAVMVPVNSGSGVLNDGILPWLWLALGVLAVLAFAWSARSLMRARVAAKRLAARVRRLRLLSSERFRALVEDGSHGTLICDGGNTAIGYASPTLRQLLGYQPAQLVGKTLESLLHQEDLREWYQALARVGGTTLPLLHRMRHADGSWRWIETRLRDLSAMPAVGGMVLNCLDVSEREHALREQRAAEQQLQIALDTSEVVLWDLHLASGAVRLSPQWAQLVGGPPGETLTQLDRLAAQVHGDDLPLLLEALKKTVAGTSGTTRVEHRVRAADGHWRWIESVGRVVERDGAGRALRVAGVNIDIDSHKQAEAQIAKLVFHDGLTGLPNRRMLVDRMTQAIEHAARHGEQLALLQLDVRHFRQINQELGRETGDAILRAVGARLSGAMREGNTLAHIGGHEFAVSMPAIGSVERAASAARALIDALAAPFKLGEHELCIGANVGVAMFPADAADAAGLLRCADAATTQAKASSQGEVYFFDPGVESQTRRRQALEHGLRAAIDGGTLTLAFQPIVDLRGGGIVGAEALVRWTHDHYGVIAPDELIPMAEETGLIAALGQWVLREACLHAARWQATLMPEFRIAVNLSALQLAQPGLVEAVQAVLASSGLRPGSLELEITEHHQLFDDWQSLKTLQRLKLEAGARLVIDDFGTGYSGLRTLRLLPLDKLKIDRSFILSAAENPADAALLAGIVAIALDLALETTAEGVENEAQLASVRRLGCDTVQGYLTGRPIPASVFTQHLAESLAQPA